MKAYTNLDYKVRKTFNGVLNIHAKRIDAEKELHNSVLLDPFTALLQRMIIILI